MIQVDRIARAFETEEKPNFFKKLQQQGLIREDVYQESQLAPMEREHYLKALEEYRLRFRTNENWSRSLNKLIAY